MNKIFRNEMNGILGHDYTLVRLNWAGVSHGLMG